MSERQSAEALYQQVWGKPYTGSEPLTEEDASYLQSLLDEESRLDQLDRIHPKRGG